MKLILNCIIIINVSLHAVYGKGQVRRFPRGFVFGAATAAYQIEGGWNEDGKGLSIWDVLTHKKHSPVDNGATGDVAADSYHQIERDVQMVKELGLDFYRFSISWPRILPSGFSNQVNKAGINYYDKLIQELLNNNIKPFATMYHWDLPYNLQRLGGWANPYVADWFADYSRVLFENFGDSVKHWITINEPKQICYEGYGSDLKAPVLNMSGIAEYMCAKNILLAHAKAYHVYNDLFRKSQNGTIGISVSATWYEATSQSQADRQAAKDARQFDWGQYIHPIFSIGGDFPVEVSRNIASKSAEQGFPRSRLPSLTVDEVRLIRNSADFLGINHYSTKLVYRDASLDGMYAVPSYMDDMAAVIIKDPSAPQAASAWLQYVPWGFTKLLKEIARLYSNPPVYITENGWSNNGGLLDEDRIHYIRSYLSAMLDAGTNVRGYFVWSLMDNFEWMRGYSERFGLYEVDFQTSNRERTPRKSAFVYKEIVRSRTLDPDYDPAGFVENRY